MVPYEMIRSYFMFRNTLKLKTNTCLLPGVVNLGTVNVKNKLMKKARFNINLDSKLSFICLILFHTQINMNLVTVMARII